MWIGVAAAQLVEGSDLHFSQCTETGPETPHAFGCRSFMIFQDLSMLSMGWYLSWKDVWWRPVSAQAVYRRHKASNYSVSEPLGTKCRSHVSCTSWTPNCCRNTQAPSRYVWICLDAWWFFRRRLAGFVAFPLRPVHTFYTPLPLDFWRKELSSEFRVSCDSVAHQERLWRYQNRIQNSSLAWAPGTCEEYSGYVKKPGFCHHLKTMLTCKHSDWGTAFRECLSSLIYSI